jgi:hypothetical protein
MRGKRGLQGQRGVPDEDCAVPPREAILDGKPFRWTHNFSEEGNSYCMVVRVRPTEYLERAE